MPYTYLCHQCGFTAEVGAGRGWATCPACGGNDVDVKKPSERAPKEKAPAADKGGKKEG